MNFYLDTEFIECAKQRRVLGFNVGPPVPTIDLISIGLVAEDGREFYALNAECELDYAWQNEWMRDNVLLPIWEEFSPALMRHSSVNYFSLKSIKKIFKEHGQNRGPLAWDLLTFIHAEAYEGWVGTMDGFFEAPFTDEHSFYGHYCDYDWVVFCQLFGRMVNLPKGFPMFCIDLKQEQDRQRIGSERKQLMCPDPVKEHHALEDARWAKRWHEVLQRLDLDYSEDIQELGKIRRALHVPALGSRPIAEKVQLLLDHVQRAARGEKISNRDEDYR